VDGRDKHGHDDSALISCLRQQLLSKEISP
jgi:hypothetical protein